jgi:hypothetical protein
VLNWIRNVTGKSFYSGSRLLWSRLMSNNQSLKVIRFHTSHLLNILVDHCKSNPLLSFLNVIRFHRFHLLNI